MILNFAGDVVLADLFEKYQTGIGTKLQRGQIDPFTNFYNLLQQADINIINLESVLSNKSCRQYPWSEIMRGSPRVLDLFKKNKISIVNLANNHTLDHGIEAFEEMTIALNQSGISYFGEPRDKFQEYPVNMYVKDTMLSFLGYYLEESLSEYSRNQFLNRIKSVIKHSNINTGILILSLHWGSEYSNKPYSWMIKYGKELIDAGVNILYGHHSHTYQGVVKYNNGLFAPSLGNFIFEDIYKKNRFSALLQVEYNNNNINYKLFPLLIKKYGIPNPSATISRPIDKINRKLLVQLDNRYDNYYDWDRKAKFQTKLGHVKNKIKIRISVLINPAKYLPFIVKMKNA